MDSEVGKRHVVESYSVSPKKIHVLPFIPPNYIFKESPSEVALKLPPNYIFYPAQFWEHKNHLRLVSAAHAIRKRGKDLHLVFAGSPKNGYYKVIEHVHRLGMERHVHFLGYVPDSQMAALYRRARAMMMPTYFGPTNIPPLEAMALGCPVAVSRIYGMPERLGDAALYFNPDSVDDLAEVMLALWENTVLCQEMTRRGLHLVRQSTQLDFNARLKGIIQSIISNPDCPQKK